MATAERMMFELKLKNENRVQIVERLLTGGCVVCLR
jgi:hypothetical protein